MLKLLRQSNMEEEEEEKSIIFEKIFREFVNEKQAPEAGEISISFLSYLSVEWGSKQH